MVCHPLSQVKWDVECIIKRLRKKFDESFIAEADPINIICPIDKQPTPDHHSQYGKIYPVKPADRKRMLFYNLLHQLVYTAV